MAKKSLYKQSPHKAWCPKCGHGKGDMVWCRFDGHVVRCWVGHVIRNTKRKKC